MTKENGFDKIILQPIYFDKIFMTIEDIIIKRNIKHLIHFTRIENLENILVNGLIPRNGMKDEFVDLLSFWMDENEEENGGKYFYNDLNRLDNKLDYSCLSVGFPNDKMFYKLKLECPHAKWVIISISPQILVNHECLFYPCNAASGLVNSVPTDNYKGAEAFENMFQNENSYPQDVQAEIMVKGVIDPKYIQGCAFTKQQYIDEYRAKFPNLKFLLHPTNRGFFGKREWTKIGY